MANSQVAMTEGSGKNAATYSISEGTTKEIQRMAMNTNAGVELLTSSAPGNVKLTDGTNAVTVKAASTVPVATDPALVVALSPNGLNANGQATAANSGPVVVAKNSGTGSTVAGAAVGTAGTASAEVITIQGIASGTVVPVSLSSTTVTGSVAVTNAGTFASQAACAGDTANAASDAGNPIKIGGVGKTANPTAVTDGQRVNGLFDKLGKQVVVGAIRDLKGIQQTSVSNTTSETTIITAVASTFLDVYGIILANTGASTTKVTIKDSTAGTTRAIIEVPTLETRGFMLPVDSAIPQATVNNNWTVTCGTATTALEVTAFYVKNI